MKIQNIHAYLHNLTSDNIVSIQKELTKGINVEMNGQREIEMVNSDQRFIEIGDKYFHIALKSIFTIAKIMEIK